MTEAEYQELLVNSINRKLARQGIYLLRGQRREWNGYLYCTDVEVEIEIESRFERIAILELKYGARYHIEQPAFYAYARRTPLFSIVDGFHQSPVKWHLNKLNSGRVHAADLQKISLKLNVLQRTIEDFNFYQLPKLR